MSKSFTLLGLITLLSGCAVGPDYHPQQAAVPAGWVGAASTTEPVGLSRWWETFSDPMLTALEMRALAANLDAKLAEAALRQSRAVRGVVAGGLWPSVNTTAEYQRLHGSPSATPFDGNITGGGRDLFQAGFDAVWELDVFGGTRRNIESADATIEAAQEGLRSAQVSLTGEVALNYIQLRGFQQQIAVAQANLKVQEHTADVTRQKEKAGFVSNLDVANADAQVATTKSQIPVLETSARQAVYALSVLLAQPPAYLLSELSQNQPIPLTPPDVPIGLPSELARRRPDIRQAEAQLHSATAQIGVATADLFPKFSLTGNVSWQSDLLRNVFSGPNRVSSFGPSVDWALFQGGSIVSNIHGQEALRDEALIRYQKSVLIALQDVENALIAYRNEREHRLALDDAVVASRKAVEVSTQLYAAGQTDFLNVLQAQGTLYASENALVQSNSNSVQDLIALYKALGGGWQDEAGQIK